MSSELDPRTASVMFSYEPIGDYPDGEWCTRRVYYWYDPEGRAASVEADEFRRRHPDVDDREWDRLFYEAFDRGETEFERQLFECCPCAAEMPSLGRLFGPRPPRDNASNDLTRESP